ncbi:two-component system response regulator BtsR [Zooshikella sp. RANM57]|uniref:two-component system response regulator BtsR n=1 Tax=Zooshikella sp. RANM57 TaxID=3425863 RepID=UPI003D6EB71C
MISALLVDDEPLAREALADLLSIDPDISIIGQAGNAIEALQMINTLHPDVVFLDIQMPRISGLELVSMLNMDDAPYVVFVTAYDEYAIRAFEDNAFDYLLKPVEPPRLQKTLARLKKNYQQPPSLNPIASAELQLIPCYLQNRIRLIKIDDVEFAFSDLSGVHVMSKEGTSHTQLTLKTLESKTPLLHCHRQYLININAIREIQLLENGLAEIITQNGHKVPVSRRYLKMLKDRFGLQ